MYHSYCYNSKRRTNDSLSLKHHFILQRINSFLSAAKNNTLLIPSFTFLIFETSLIVPVHVLVHLAQEDQSANTGETKSISVLKLQRHEATFHAAGRSKQEA